MQMEQTYTPSRPVNLYRKPNAKYASAVYDRLDAIQAEVELQEQRRKRDVTSSDRFRQCLRAICLDLFDAYVADAELQTGVPRDNSAFSKNDPSLPAFVTARPFLDALQGLIKTGYVDQLSLGSEASSRRTRVRGTQRLVERLGVGGLKPRHLIDTSDTIVLRVGRKGNKRRIAFEDTPDIIRWRQNLNRINGHLNAYRITLDMSHAKWRKMEADRLAEARHEAEAEKTPLDYTSINTNRVRLHRVFNSPDWTKGGRFYGGWWQSVPKPLRPNIQINGKYTCEYDFSSMHLRLLYKLVGAVAPEVADPYSEPFGPDRRSAVKRAFNVMLNAARRPSPKTVPEFNEKEFGMTWEQFTDSILGYHKPLQDYFLSGKGLELQRLDADIAEAVMLSFTCMGQPCLPIHDSFITYKTLEDELPQIMQDVAHQIGGSAIPSKPVYSAEYTGPTGPVTDDIGDLLNLMRDE